MSNADSTIDAVGSPPQSAPLLETGDYGELETVERRHYVLEGEIARGGMGCVTAARDRRLGRTVAIKEVLTGSEERAARFVREARVTARLSHPSIIHVYEAGRWPNGDPFFAMPRVAGQSLDRAVEACRSLDERLGLVRHVIAASDALAHAHARGVIHRDLKPSNVLVGKFGETVVIDWGLARERDRAPPPGEVVGTPQYMPPEQGRGEPTDERADVYALGAMLYHVLAGAPPYRGQSKEVLEKVLEGPPRALRDCEPQVPRDLAAIVDKAMAREPAARYGNAAELSADLMRFANGQLVAARNYAWHQQLVRFVRRHAIMVGAALIVIVIAAISVWRIVVANGEARAQAERAERRFGDVRRFANSMLDEVDRAMRDVVGTTHARELLVTQSLAYLDRLGAESDRDPVLDREVALAYMKVGDIQGNVYEPNLGKFTDGLASYAKAKQVLLDSDDADPDPAARAVAHARLALGIAFLHYANRDHAATLAALEEGLPRAARLSPGALDLLTLGRGLLARLEIVRDQGHHTEAARRAGEALALVDSWPDQRDPEIRYWRGVYLDSRAEIALHAGDPEATISDATAARAILEPLHAEHPQSQRYGNEVIYPRFLLGVAYLGMESGGLWFPSTGQVSAAEDNARLNLARAQPILSRDRYDARNLLRLATRYVDLGLAVNERSPSEALPVFESALAMFERIDPDFRVSGFVRSNEFLLHCVSAVTLAAAGRAVEARERIRRGLALTSGDALAAAMCSSRSAMVERALGDRVAAIGILREVAVTLRGVEKLQARIGLVETLEQLAALETADACRLRGEALAAWRGKPLATAFYRRLESELDRRRAGCR